MSLVAHSSLPLSHINGDDCFISPTIERSWETPFEAVDETGRSKSMPLSCYTIWTLPNGDCDFSGRWSVIKKHFTAQFLLSGGADWSVSHGTEREKRRGVGQRRFWEHTIRDEDDFESHFDYIHFNPVKHKLVKCPCDWQASSFHRLVEQGVYPSDWACGNQQRPEFSDATEYGEPE